MSVALISFALAQGSGCSVRQMAMRDLSQAVAGGGDVLASDDDPELIRDAAPVLLKLIEALLQESPKDEGLLLAASRGFIQYAYAFVDLEADYLASVDLARSRELKRRARGLYLRGRDYALRALELRHAGFAATLRQDRAAALAGLTTSDLEAAYWAGASWALAVTADKDDLELMAELPLAGALASRVRELDPAFGEGAVQEFFITYEGARSGAGGGSVAAAREAYREALRQTRGHKASVHLALAEAVSIDERDRAEFDRLLAAARAVDVNAEPRWRLANAIAQRRAEWLVARTDELFFPNEP